jgi:5-formyltetrahydrofolate cyclo-ligase
MDKSDESKSAAKKALRRQLLERRLNLPDRLLQADLLQQVMRIWLVGRPDTVIGAYWPIKGEFDPLPALHRWKEDGELLDQPQRRRIGLPVVNKEHKTMTFHVWYPGCPMEEDAYGIPKPKDTEVIVPTLLFAPCVGYGPGGYRLGYGGGFYDRMMATLEPKPFTVGLGFGVGFMSKILNPRRTMCRWTPFSTTTGWCGRCSSLQTLVFDIDQGPVQLGAVA